MLVWDPVVKLQEIFIKPLHERCCLPQSNLELAPFYRKQQLENKYKMY